MQLLLHRLRLGWIAYGKNQIFHFVGRTTITRNCVQCIRWFVKHSPGAKSLERSVIYLDLVYPFQNVAKGVAPGMSMRTR